VSVRVVKVTARALGAITVHRVAPPTPPHIVTYASGYSRLSGNWGVGGGGQGAASSSHAHGH